MRHTMGKVVKTTNVQQLAWKSTLNNFALNTWPNNCINKLLFSVKWQLKLIKQGAKIMLIDKLQQIFEPECILDTLSLKPWVDDFIVIFTNAILSNIVKNIIENLV